jgi:hypothetical protein
VPEQVVECIEAACAESAPVINLVEIPARRSRLSEPRGCSRGRGAARRTVYANDWADTAPRWWPSGRGQAAMPNCTPSDVQVPSATWSWSQQLRVWIPTM